MSTLVDFFKTTREELDKMVTWHDGVPVDEFWEMFTSAEQEAQELEIRHEKLLGESERVLPKVDSTLDKLTSRITELESEIAERDEREKLRDKLEWGTP